MTTITHSTGTITPTIVDGFTSTRESGTLVHPILGSENPDVTLRPAALRAGILTLVFASASAATAAEMVMASAQVLTLTDPDVSQIGMSFVVTGGGIELDLDRESRSAWLLRVPFQEVAP